MEFIKRYPQYIAACLSTYSCLSVCDSVCLSVYMPVCLCICL